MTRVLVAHASKHGATAELAGAIGSAIADQGHAVDIRPIDEIDDLERYDAIVLGSAVYMGAWMGAAREFAAAHREAILARPTWLFSSGPIGADEAAAGSVDVARLVAETKARDHHLFGGRLDHSALTWGERLVARVLHAPEGDYREWDAAVAWGTAIARSLAPAHPVSHHEFIG